MRRGFFRIFFMLMFAFSVSAAAQVKLKRDSLYQRIENFSTRRKATKLLYRLLFREHADTATVRTNTAKVEQPKYQGKHIRKIVITTLDPLGYNTDMQKVRNNKVENFGNKLHVKTKAFVVRGYLLFKKGDEYNGQKLYESERLLRSTDFVNRVAITPIDSTMTADSVDIAVRILDDWSLKPTASFSQKQLGIGAAENNFMGLGHELALQYRYDFGTRQHYEMAAYRANNIYGTYINGQILAEKDMFQNENVYIRGRKDFFSPLTKWAGGISLDYFRHFIQIPTSFDINPILFPTAQLQVHSHDFWGGYQFVIPAARSEKITDNIALAGRFQNYIYMTAPPPNLDPGNFFRSYDLFLGSVQFVRRNFKVTKNVFQYLMPEDIPYGEFFGLTGGAVKEFGAATYPYAGLTAAYGAFTSLGYFNFTAQYGSFFKLQKNYRAAFRVDGTYFTNLQDVGFAKARHFFSPTFVLGNERNPSFVDRINISAPSEFPVYNPNYVGNDKLILRYQLQLFFDKSWKNFSFSPYFITAVGWLSNDEKSLFSSRINTKFGIGMEVYNPFLSFNRFQVSFVFYPKLPFDENNAYEINRYRSSQMPMNSFTAGEPGIVNYTN